MKFETKARTLSFLQSQNLVFTVPKLYFFSIYEWRKKREEICNYIKKNFNSLIVIRSSALNEDTLKNSSAGSYESFLNIKNNRRKIIENINGVINSYKNKKNFNKNNQILIQNMVKNVWTSGVIFTKNINNSSPYYIINYDDKSGKTDKVTSGNDKYANKVLKILRGKENQLLSPRFQKLLKGTKQLEKLYNNENLDIEFVIDKHLKIYLLQVRPLTKILKFKNKKIFLKKIKKIDAFLKKNSADKDNIKNIYGQMPDWNPAEMIGKYPKDLALSLYSNLITEKSWYLARKQMGYSQSKNNKLMLNLAGQPFIDTKKSFNSLIPFGVPRRLTEKLVFNSLKKLKNYPELHDKIEFECSVSCQTLNTKKLIKQVYSNKLTKKEIIIFSKYLNKLTVKNLKLGKNSLFELSKKKIGQLQNFQKLKNNYELKNLNKYVNFLKKNGIIPFSIFARYAFISKIILKSVVDLGIFSKNEEHKFLYSINNVVTELIKDSNRLANQEIKLSTFKKKYGHLRPGTYDIESKSYNSMSSIFFKSFKNKNRDKKLNKFSLSKLHKEKFMKIALKENFPTLDFEFLLNFIKQSIYWREYSKFVFTKSIDQIFLTIKKFGRENQISLSELAFFDIKYFYDLKKNRLNKKSKNKILRLINLKKRDYSINNFIELPTLIKSNTDSFIVPSQISMPNFISNRKVIGKKIYLDNKTQKINSRLLKNKIVMIEGADPGYDWIFLHNISGLITKFGGANSHMSIRCSELSIPAAIGCGNEKFDELLNFQNLEIDPLTNTINGNF